MIDIKKVKVNLCTSFYSYNKAMDKRSEPGKKEKAAHLERPAKFYLWFKLLVA
jgi:hypothetical protein